MRTPERRRSGERISDRRPSSKRTPDRSDRRTSDRRPSGMKNTDANSSETLAKKRCFIAIDLPKLVKEEIIALQDSLKEFPGMFTYEKNPHLTLAFWSEGVIDDVKKKLRHLKHRPFTLELSTIGAFGNPARVFWVGINEGHKLEHLSKHFGTLNEFHAHITIARTKKNVDPALTKKIIDIKTVPVKFVVDEIVLYESVKAKERYLHKKIATVELQ